MSNPHDDRYGRRGYGMSTGEILILIVLIAIFVLLLIGQLQT